MPVDNYEQCKRVINHLEIIHAYIYIYTVEWGGGGGGGYL